MHSRPYCNRRIILAIQHLFFTASGGSPSLATQFDDLFPGTTGDDGLMVPEVPIPMVALVATAVSACFPMHVIMLTEITTIYQLFASIYDWRTGTQQAMEFSTNAYYGVYQAHVSTLQLIQDQRVKAFHTMIPDIYSQVR